MSRIYLSPPHIGDNSRRYVAEAFETNWVAPLGPHVDAFERRVSPGGDVYYWAASTGVEFRDSVEGADVDLLLRKCITVTPLWHDLTDNARIDEWKRRI